MPDYPSQPFPPPGGPGRSRWKLVTALVGAGALVVVLGVGGWLYFSGRLGFGPLSAADEAAAETIADSVEAPGWTDDEAVACAAEELLHDTRSSDLEEHGTIEKDGDGWSYTEEWEADDADRFGQGLLECTDDWESEVADAWGLSDDDCLGDIGAGTMGQYFGNDVLQASGEDAGSDAVEELDDCYVTDPEEPEGKAKPGYRSVKFKLSVPEIENAQATFSVGHEGEFEKVKGSTHSVDTGEGGVRTCVTVKAEAEYAWGTTTASEGEVCGKAKPKKLWWVRGSGCESLPGGFTCWELKYEGYKSFDLVNVSFTENGGDCGSTSGTCSDTAFTKPEGRGTIARWGLPSSYSERFEAKVDGQVAVLPN